MTQFYSKYQYPRPGLYEDPDGVVRRFRRNVSVAGEGASILVVGCGTAEAVMVASENPKHWVIGVDSSPTSVDSSATLMRKMNLRNLEHHCCDFFDYADDGGHICAIASGVIHHVPRAIEFCEKIRSHVGPDGYLTGMVYNDEGREHILETRRETMKLSTPDEVRDYMFSLMDDHPSRLWWQRHDQSDNEVADTWLNPYAVHYTEGSMRVLLEAAGWQVNSFQPEPGKLGFVAQNSVMKDPQAENVREQRLGS